MIKSLEDFYRRPSATDGRSSDCKLCNNARCKARREAKMKDPEWVIAERERCRVKAARRRSEGKTVPSEVFKPLYQRRSRRNNPEKYRAWRIANAAKRRGVLKVPEGCEVCGCPIAKLDMHHEDYTKPLEVVFMCPTCHGKTRRKNLVTPAMVSGEIPEQARSSAA